MQLSQTHSPKSNLFNDTGIDSSLLFSDYYENVVSRVDKLRSKFNVEVVTEFKLGSSYLPLYKISSHDLCVNSHAVLITAGVHGNEKGGVQGALDYMQSDADLETRAGIVCYPCVNPRGYVLNTRWTGEKSDSRTDINRTFFENSGTEEVIAIINSLRNGPARYVCAMDLHETMPDDGIVMAMQYPDRDLNPYEKSPEGFYMWEICHDISKRVGRQVIDKLELFTPVCKWEEIFDEINSGGVIFYPEGARNSDYVEATSLDAFVHRNYTDHAYTTETYGGLELKERAGIQRQVVKLIMDHLLT